jgi:uncharacterized membrane protein
MKKTIVVLAFIGSLAMANNAAAKWQVCNRSQSSTKVAVAWQHEGTYYSKGWFQLAPNGCETIMEGKPLGSSAVYVFARSKDGGIWEGGRNSSLFCVKEGRDFELKGASGDPEACRRRGYTAEAFVGGVYAKRDHTTNLRSSGKNSIVDDNN